MNKNPDCNPYAGGEIPPCSAYLGNVDPIIKDGKVIYRNENRLYFFISTILGNSPGTPPSLEPETTSPIAEEPFSSSNLQISLSTFIVGLYLYQIQQGKIKYDKTNTIHSNKTADEFIHQSLQNPPQFDTNYTTTLSLIVSHSNSIIPLYTHALSITSLNYYILFILSRLENNPGLFFGNNSFVDKDPINIDFAALNIQFPL